METSKNSEVLAVPNEAPPPPALDGPPPPPGFDGPPPPGPPPPGGGPSTAPKKVLKVFPKQKMKGFQWTKIVHNKLKGTIFENFPSRNEIL
jgi:hypothetical protein